MKKSNVGKTGGINTNALIGGVVGGAANAVVDRYVTPLLPNSESLPVAPLVKVAAGRASYARERQCYGECGSYRSFGVWRFRFGEKIRFF